MNTRIRIENISKVLTLINRHGSISRKEISDKLGITTMTVSNVINYLINEKVCREVGKDLSEKRIGRKKLLVEIDYNYKQIIGINIRTVKESWEISIVISNINHSEFNEEVFYFDKNTEVEILLTNIINKVKQLINNLSLKEENILGMGISITGVVDSAHGVVINSPTGLKNVLLNSYFKEHFSFPIYTINNIKALAISKLIFNSLDEEDFLYLRYDEGIGSAIIYNNSLFAEKSITSGKLGHLSVNSSDERKCSCGRINCLESFVHFRELRKFLPDNITVSNKELVDLYGQNHSELNKAFDRAFELIALNLSNVSRFLGVPNIVLDGYIFSKEETFSKFIEKINKYTNLEKDTINYIKDQKKLSKASGAVGYLLMMEFYKNSMINH